MTNDITTGQTTSLGTQVDSGISKANINFPEAKYLSPIDPPLSDEAVKIAQQNAATNKYTQQVQKAYKSQQRVSKQQSNENTVQSTKVTQSSAISSLPDPKQAATSLTKGPGGATIISQKGLYQKVATKHQEILDALYTSLRSKNEATRLSAAKILLAKILPDLKAIEVGGEVNADGTRDAIQLYIDTGKGFIPATVQPHAAPAPSITTESQEIQDVDLAQTGTQNDNSNIRDSQAGTS